MKLRLRHAAMRIRGVPRGPGTPPLDPLAAVERAIASVRGGLANASPPHLERIERRRAALEASDETILLPRSEYSGDPADSAIIETVEVRAACYASVSPSWGALLYALVRELRPDGILELGTNLGLSTAYIAAGLEQVGSGMLVSGDASRERLAIAKETLVKAKVADRVSLVHGRFQETLPHMLERLGRVELAFVDGHHDEEATVHYVDTIAERSTEEAVLVLDDIRWSDGMTRAWEIVGDRRDVCVAVDLGAMGILIRGSGRRKLERQI